jgi:hypothetical protein
MTSPGLATLNLKCRGLESQGELETPIGKIIFIQKIIIQHAYFTYWYFKQQFYTSGVT